MAWRVSEGYELPTPENTGGDTDMLIVPPHMLGELTKLLAAHTPTRPPDYEADDDDSDENE
jgi:hypothetical protein